MTWGPYFDRIFPVAWTNGFGQWKRHSLGVNIAQHLWGLREAQRVAHEVIHGPDPDLWPAEHPGVVLVAQEHPWSLYPACLRCQWLGTGAITYADRRRIRRTWRYAKRHERCVVESQA